MEVKSIELELDGTTYLDGAASDPRNLGWMRGTPPPADRVVAPERSLEFPEIRWSLSHMRELRPTVNVPRGNRPPASLRVAEKDHATAISDISFSDLTGQVRSWDQALLDTYTDGILVLHRGQVVYERYLGALTAELPHSCFSVTKSYAGTLALWFVMDGVLDDQKKIPYYLPELQGTAWEDATLRQVMDMETGLEYDETYDDPNSGVSAYLLACGLRPRPSDYNGQRTTFDYLRTIRKEGEHGTAFAYKTVNTEVMAWVMARATGRSLSQLLHELVWVPLGCEQDSSLVVDNAGTPMAGGGLSASLRDLARFGEVMRRQGDWNGKQIIPATVVHEVERGGDPNKFAKAGYALWPGHSYRSQWWVTHNELGAYEARGIHGQRLHVAPGAELVVARFASHPVAATAGNEPITGPLLQAVAGLLQG